MKGENMKKNIKKFKRFIAILLTLTLLIGSIPMTEWRVMAEQLESTENNESTETVAEDATDTVTEDTTEAEKKSDAEDVSESQEDGSTEDNSTAENETTSDEGSGSEVVDSGSCGENVTWVLTADGTLTILGPGKMADYTRLYDDGNLRYHSTSPWDSQKDSILSVDISVGVTSIGNCAFFDCSSLNSIEIPEGVSSIGEFAFVDCSSLSNIEIPNSVSSIGSSAFSSCSSLSSIEIPKGVTSIEERTFYSCSNLSSIEIPEGVSSIGSSAFSSCSSLSSIEIPKGVSSIGSSAFSSCSSLSSIEIPKGVTSIEECTFYSCSNLSSIEIPEGVTSIEERTFDDCSSLSSIEIPEGVTSIEERTFDDCSSLSNIEIPNSVTSIGESAFIGCSSLSSIEIPEGVSSIGSSAFEDCSSLSSIEIPEGVSSIEGGTFDDCRSLSNIEIPNSVSSIGSAAFSRCSSLSSIEIPKGVTSIEERTFYSCSNLSSIEIPEGVSSIGSAAFGRCSSLSSIEIPEGVSSIEMCTFIGCRSLSSIEIPKGVSSIGSSAFDGCRSLSSIEIPEGVSSIGSSAFEDCSSLSSIEIPNSVSSIGSSAFRSCSSLSNIEIPNSVTSIRSHAFNGCSSLSNIEIPNSVSSIGESAFRSCSSLSSIEIPDSVSSIGDFAFVGCKSLTDVYYSGTEEEWSKIEIGSSNSYLTNATIHYNSTGPDTSINPIYDGYLSIKIFTEWDDKAKTVVFDDGRTYWTNEDTDLSFLDNLDELIGKKVLVVVDKSEVGLLKGIYPVEAIKGKITEWNSTSLTLDGETYLTAQDFSVNGLKPLPETISICYLHEGVVVGLSVAEEKTGILEAWDGNSNEITIDGNTYSVETDDLSFLQSIQNWMGETIQYILLDDIVIQINLLDYNTNYTGKLESYDEETGALNFSDGESYYVADDLEESPSDFIGKWGVYTISTSQNEGVKIIKIEPVTTELEVTLIVNQKDIYYKDGKFGFDKENLENRSDFEIPYTVKIQTITNANPEVVDELKNVAEYDVTINNLDIEIPSDFNFGWITKEGDIQSIDKGTVIHVGDTIGAAGFIRPDFGYTPELVTNNYTIKCNLDTSIGEGYGSAEFTITQDAEDATDEVLVNSAADALSEISDCIAINNMADFFDHDTNRKLCSALMSVALLARAEEADFQEQLSEELFDEVFGDWKLKTGANTFDVPVKVVINTVDYGELIFEFTMHITKFNLNGTDYGIFGTIDYEIIGGSGMQKVQEKAPHRLRGSNVGVISRADGKAFCDAAYQLAEGEIKKAYNTAWGKDANKVADAIFGDTVKLILKGMDKSFSDAVFDMITHPTTKMAAYCPVDVYLYNDAGELCASIVNNEIEKTSEDIYLEVVGDTKIVMIENNAYDLVLDSNGIGDMDLAITEYAGRGRILHTTEFYDISLGDNLHYSYSMNNEVLSNDYVLTDQDGATILPDSDGSAFEPVNPDDTEEHVHLYGEPEFQWSEDGKSCTAVFTCNMNDDVQEVKCAVTTEEKAPTCTETGKYIYTATVPFNEREYTDVKEEEIPATGHEYKYEDNGDGTHTKVCTICNLSEAEPHTYEENICKYCKAEKPEDHSHAYGSPTFEWAKDYKSCIAVFMCKDGDDVQRIDCEVTSKMTNPTCTEDGKAVYTAKVSFEGAEFTETKEEMLPATGHSYEYKDNGDGTHTKACSSCDVRETEAHTYEDGICKYCKAEEPKEHSHAYGSPEFEWSEDYKSCVAVFTCKDGDDIQRIDCEVTSDTTDPTCTEAGKAVYTAKVSFAGAEFTETKEEMLPATGHSYEYKDNGDGTHTKVCKNCEESASEAHSYADSVCEYCGAEEPEEHSHAYSSPKFEWSKDGKSCTAVFSCKDGDDEQRVECEVTSKITDPTCTEDGKTVYTATVSFAGAEFTDTKEESIPSTGHTYEYVDNGDSTHTKTCTICDESESEPHTYEDGTCKYCKAEEPEEHSHEYGKPKFEWSKDNKSCTAVFTCKDGDDEQRVECEVTSKTTDPTCTKDGKIVYKAVVSFEGEEYTDTKEKKIEATGHTYEYQDNGDGTHKKVCTSCGKSITESHDYQKGVCKQCGAEQPNDNHHNDFWYYDFGKGIRRFFEKIVIPFWENLFQIF